MGAFSTGTLIRCREVQSVYYNFVQESEKVNEQ